MSCRNGSPLSQLLLKIVRNLVMGSNLFEPIRTYSEGHPHGKRAMEKRRNASAIDEICAALGLSDEDLTALLGVPHRAVEYWRVQGIPEERTTQIAQYRELCRYLSRALAPDRIPAIIRRPVPRLGGKSWLDNMRERGPEDTQNQLRAVLSCQLI